MKKTEKTTSDNVENTAPTEKKKLRGYALVRVIMMWVFAGLFVIFITVSIMYMVRNHIAKESTDKVMSDFNEITNAGTAPEASEPVIIPPQTPPETLAPSASDTAAPPTTGDAPGASEPETTPGTPGATTPPTTAPIEDEAYKQYVAQCIAEAKKMKEQYPDFRAIIVIEGDTINLKYPVLQGEDNRYYVEHLIDGSYNSTGEIFLDYRNSPSILSNRNSVIYGHNMNDGSKFGQIHKFKHNNAFYTHNVTIITAEEVMVFKPFSFYRTNIYTPYATPNFETAEEFAEFCRSEQEKSMFESSFNFTGGERIITLSTCYGTSATERYCLHAVLVNITK